MSTIIVLVVILTILIAVIFKSVTNIKKKRGCCGDCCNHKNSKCQFKDY